VNVLTVALQGIRGILDREKVEREILLRHSLGVLFALCFGKRYPERVSFLIIANFAIPAASRVRIMKRMLEIMAVLPGWINVRIVKRQLGRLLKDYQDRFWLSYLTGPIADTPLRYIGNHYRCIYDFLQNWAISPEALKLWKGDALILESDQERVSTAERTAMESPFPRAAVHCFRNAGHMSWITPADKLVLAVANFLRTGYDSKLRQPVARNPSSPGSCAVWPAQP